MADAEVLVLGKANRLRPNVSQPDNTISDDAMRLGPYNEQYGLSLYPGKQILAEEGSYFYATNPTIGTPVTHALTTAFAATAALFAIKNTSYDRFIHLDFLRLHVGAVPATKLTEEILVEVDAVQNRIPTANAVIITPVSNLAKASSIAQLFAFSGGALTVPTGAVSARKVSRGKIPTNVVITNDVLTFQFGGADYGQQAQPLTAVRAVQAASLIAHCAPVAIEPQSWAVIYRWGATEATTPNTYEYELGWSER